VRKDQLDQKELWVKRDQVVTVVLLVVLAQEERLDLKANLDQMGTRDPKDKEGHQDHKEDLDLKDLKEFKDLEDQ